MSMHQSELPDAKTPSRKGFTVGRIQAGAACILRLETACGLASDGSTGDLLADFYLVRLCARPPRPHAVPRPPPAPPRRPAARPPPTPGRRPGLPSSSPL